MANWWAIADAILDLVEFGDEDRPTIQFVTKNSAQYLNAGRTMFRDNSSFGYTDDIWIYPVGEKSYVLYTVFHECWHAFERKKGFINKYSDEDRSKYVEKSHMMMLYKYDFEARATGYAAAFVYELFFITSKTHSCNLEKTIEDKYDSIDTFPEDQFDSYQDYFNINNKIKFYYEEGKQYFEDKFKNQVNKNMVEDLKHLSPNIDEKLFYLVTPLAVKFININKFLK